MEEYHVENFGCRASRADGEVIGAELRQRGMQPAAEPRDADVIVANTCSVTAQADRTARAFLRRMRRENPSARIVVTGCYAQRAPLEVAGLPGVHAVVGNSHKALVAAIASRTGEGSPPGQQGFVSFAALGADVFVDDAFAHAGLAMPQGGWVSGGPGGGQTRPNLKVQDGCGNRCTFCIIPTTRGHSRSLPLDACLQSVRAFAAGGGVELVLSGINLGRWGRDLQPQQTLDALISAILSETALPRLRLSSIEPMDWSPQLLSLFARYSEPEKGGTDGRLARHAHIPLQSGSDAILRAMHRRYRPWHYAEKVRLLRAVMPDAAIGADVMVGFPGETDALFEESFNFIAAQPFTYLHLFPFSARPGTQGWKLAQEQPVAPAAVTERLSRLRTLIDGRNQAFREGFVGRTLPAVTLQAAEKAVEQAAGRALTDNFLEVRLVEPLPANLKVCVHVVGLTPSGLAAQVCR